MKYFLVLIAGILFGCGLALSSMIDPTVVLAFLDVAGQWNPALMFVMVGALAVTTLGFKWVLNRKAPVYDREFHLPQSNNIDSSLISGAVLFGIGWGLIGYCPGPAIAGLALLQPETFYFVLAMFVGLKCSQWFAEITQGGRNG